MAWLIAMVLCVTQGCLSEAHAQAGPVRGRLDDPLKWPERYRKSHVVEGILGPLLVTSALSLYFGPPPPTVDLSYGNSFDRNLQERLSIRSETYNNAAEVISDAGFYGSVLYRTFDDIVMVGLRRRSWDVAWRLAAMDAMAFGLVGSVVWTTHLFVGRQRPSSYYCATDPEYQGVKPGCDPNSDASARSMISGHVGVMVAGASLTCLHHAHLPIYERRGSLAACGAHLGAAAVASAARSLGDHHWPTDIALGTGLGLVAGWLLPRALHYGFDTYALRGQTRPSERARGTTTAGHFAFSASPWFEREGAGARVLGAF